MRLLSPTLCLAVAGCAGAHATSSLRDDVARSARDRIGQRQLTVDGKLLEGCLALPKLALFEHGLKLEGASPEALYQRLRHEGRFFAAGIPRKGDLVFLRERGAASQAELHVGLVGSVEQDGTVVVFQRMARGVVAYRMNPRHPTVEQAPHGQRLWNDRVALLGGGTAPAGTLFSGYASVLP